MSSSFNTSLTSQRKADLEELRVLAAEVIGFVDDEEKMEVREQMENLQTLSEGIMDTVSRMVKPPASDEEDISALELPPLCTSTPAAKRPSHRSSTGSTEIRRIRSPRAIVLKSSDEDERDGFEWDDSDMLRDLEDSHIDDEEAPIPIISPLETAAAPLEKLIDDGRTKVDQVEYLNRCETPNFSKLDGFTNDYEKIVDKTDESIEKVHKQLLYPSILDASWKDQAQALINKWEDVRVGASQRSERLREKFEKAELLLTDVNLALAWLKENNLLELMHKQDGNASKQNDELNETDSEKTFRKFQTEIAKLKNLALNTKEQKPKIENLTKTADNAFWDEELKLKIENLNVQWNDFTKGIDAWKLKIETKIKKSKEYENVITRAEELVGELHKKTQDEYESGEVVKLADELQTLRSRVTKLESIISELHAVENLEEKTSLSDDSLQNSIGSNEPMRSSTPKRQQRISIEETQSERQRQEDIFDGFDTLRIVKTICDKELEFTEKKLEEHNNNYKKTENDLPELIVSPADPLDTSECLENDEETSNDHIEEIVEPQEAHKSEIPQQQEQTIPDSRRKRAKLLFYSMILSYPTYAYALPFLTFIYSLLHCQSDDQRNCPLERFRHPEITLTWPNGAPAI